MIYGWFNEYEDANMDYISAFRDHDEGLAPFGCGLLA